MGLKIAFNSKYGLGKWFTLRLLEEGHSVDIYQTKSEYANILGGIAPKPYLKEKGNDKYPDYSKYDLSIFEVSGNAKQADFSALHCPTIGDGSFNCEAEDNRAFGIEIMEKAGIGVPPYESFTDTNTAKAFIKKNNKRYVFKPSGDVDDKGTTYVSEDPEDMILEIDKLFEKTKGAPFILQEFIKGIEVAVEGWFNGEKFYLVNCTLEEKKFMNDNKGPNTGAAGNILFPFKGEEPKVYKEGLKKMESYLKKIEYVGMLDLNTIVTDKDIYGLEWTPRFGYVSSATIFQLYNGNLGKMFHDIATGKVPKENWGQDFASGISMTIPPYPSEIKGHHPDDVVVKGIDPKDYHRIYLYDVELKEKKLTSAGHTGFICCPMGTGDSITEAFDKCNELMEKIRLPNAQYRTDMSDTTRERFYDLKSQGWL